ncbi:MAG TPA: hypothetical protein PK916_08790 [Bacteroidota bacterium]|nr:hypothetical protein [Bacteroidota bacterium]
MKLRPWFWIGVLLMALYNHADFLWQAEMHVWPAWLDLTHRAPHWPWYLDWIPHDGWHVVQSIKNHAALLGSALVFYGTVHRWRSPWWELVAVLLVYGLTRFLCFTLFLP